MTEGRVLHVVTVGRSLLGRLADLPQIEHVLDPKLLNSKVGDELHRLAGDGPIGLGVILPDDSAVAAVRAAAWKLAAEWTSLAAYRSTPTAVPQEAVIYVASDTDDGLRAATLLAMHTTTAVGYDGTVRYVHDIDPDGRVVQAPGEVAVVRLPGLEFVSSPRSAEKGERTWKALGDLGRSVATSAHADGWSVVLHLSGGFKAANPYLLVMAEGIRTRLRAHHRGEGQPCPDVSAVCVHESSVDAGDPYLVQLPVRYLSSPMTKLLRDPNALDKAELQGQFTTAPTATEPARFTWAGIILVHVLRGWP